MAAQRNPCEKLPDTWLKEQSSLADLIHGNPGQFRKVEGKNEDKRAGHMPRIDVMKKCGRRDKRHSRDPT
jgi:hypothetical protein